MPEKACSSERAALLSNEDTKYAQQKINTLQEVDENDNKHTTSMWTDSTTRQKLIFMLIIFGHTVVFMCVSTPFPFMTKYLAAKGGDDEEASLILQLVMLVMAISSAVFGKYQGNIGTRKLFLGGLFCFGAGQALFGILEYAESATTIVAVGSVIRIAQGCGQGAYLVAALTVICQEFPNHAGQAFAIAETFASAGYTCGPLVGSLLFSASNGILVPFLVTDLLLVPLFLAGAYLLKDYVAKKDDKESIHPFNDFVKSPISVLILGIVASTYGIFGLVDVLIVVYLTNIGFNIVEVGFAFLAMATTYSVFSVLVGFVSNIGIKTRRATFLLGLFGLCGISFLFTPTQTKPWAYAASTIFGMFCAFTLITSFAELLHIAVGERVDMKKNFTLHSALSGLWNLAFGVGGFTFPIIGSALLRVTRFEFSLFISYVIGIGFSFMLALFAAIWKYCSNRYTCQNLDFT